MCRVEARSVMPYAGAPFRFERLQLLLKEKQGLFHQPANSALLAAFPASEEFEELIPGFWIDRVLGQTPHCLHCMAHLLHVPRAAWTKAQVRLEARAFRWRQRIFKIIADKLHQFLTRKLGRRGHPQILLLSVSRVMVRLADRPGLPCGKCHPAV